MFNFEISVGEIIRRVGANQFEHMLDDDSTSKDAISIGNDLSEHPIQFYSKKHTRRGYMTLDRVYRAKASTEQVDAAGNNHSDKGENSSVGSNSGNSGSDPKSSTSMSLSSGEILSLGEISLHLKTDEGTEHDVLSEGEVILDTKSGKQAHDMRHSLNVQNSDVPKQVTQYNNSYKFDSVTKSAVVQIGVKPREDEDTSSHHSYSSKGSALISNKSEVNHDMDSQSYQNAADISKKDPHELLSLLSSISSPNSHKSQFVSYSDVSEISTISLKATDDLLSVAASQEQKPTEYHESHVMPQIDVSKASETSQEHSMSTSHSHDPVLAGSSEATPRPSRRRGGWDSAGSLHNIREEIGEATGQDDRHESLIFEELSSHDERGSGRGAIDEGVSWSMVLGQGGEFMDPLSPVSTVSQR